jgi:hypothetical protein
MLPHKVQYICTSLDWFWITSVCTAHLDPN